MSALPAPLVFPEVSRSSWRWAKRFLLVSSDVAALIFAITLAEMTCALLFSYQPRLEWQHFVPIVALLGAFSLTDLYSEVAANTAHELRRILWSATVVLGSFGASEFFASSAAKSKVILSWAISVSTIALFRGITRGAFARRSWWGTPAVILGGGATAWEIARILARRPSLGLNVVAVLGDASDSRHASEISQAPLSMAPHFARDLRVPYAIIPASNARLFQTSGLSQAAASFQRVLVIPDLMGLPSLWGSAREVGGMLGIELPQNLRRPAARFLKRLCDITLAGGAVIALAPVLALVYLAIRVSSKGPGLYRQSRLGRNGKSFTAWKFRTMAVDADAILITALREDGALRAEWERDHKLKNDPRVTRIGRILRKTSLDELPQLFNIVKGDMTLVGPRPIVKQEIAKYGDSFDAYCRVRPGLTGLWQVSGRNDTTYEERVQFDDYYVRNWSFWLDLYILFRTVKTVVLGEGAY